MNVKGNANRSVRQTKKRLSDALVALLLEKPAQAITVRELTARAKVSRGTFYFHYTDISDLLHQLEQEQVEQTICCPTSGRIFCRRSSADCSPTCRPTGTSVWHCTASAAIRSSPAG